jgi:hypothetical protein
MGGEREIGVPEGGERGEHDEIAEGGAVANDALLHESLEAEGMRVAAGRIEGVPGLEEAEEPGGVSVGDWSQGHAWVVGRERNGRGERWRSSA